jgi:hypothetical protein
MKKLLLALTAFAFLASAQVWADDKPADATKAEKKKKKGKKKKDAEKKDTATPPAK